MFVRQLETLLCFLYEGATTIRLGKFKSFVYH